ncbi:hypothetical protein ACEPAI_1786 [Sanghuangporus weigelae]
MLSTNQPESTQINWSEKAKLKADVTGVCWQPTSAFQAATHEAGPIPVQKSLQTEGGQEPVHSFGTPEKPTTMCQYPDFFNASIAIGQQAPFQIHQPCEPYAITTVHLIDYQASSSCSYKSQATSMGFVPVNRAGPAIISSGQQVNSEMSFGFNGALQAAQPSMPFTWFTSVNSNATSFEAGRQYVNADVMPTWRSPLEPHAPSQAQSQTPWAAQAQVVPRVSFHRVPLPHRANSYLPQLTPLPAKYPQHSSVHPLDQLAHDDQDFDETTEKPQSRLSLRRVKTGIKRIPVGGAVQKRASEAIMLHSRQDRLSLMDLCGFETGSCCSR